MKPIAFDLFAGLGGWSEGLLAEGFNVIGFDIEAHDYGDGKRYPAQLVIQDVLTIHGRQFKDAVLIVASPPCQFFSYCAMPWSRAKKLAAVVRADPVRLEIELALFKACFRIQREAIAAAGRFIPMVVENVRGAQPWVGRARWNFGSYYLWGDVPALMPITMPRRKSKVGSWDTTRANFNPDKTWDEGLKLPGNNSPRRWDECEVQRLCDAGQKNSGGSWFNIGSPGQKEVNRNPVHELAASGFKTAGMNWSDRTLRGQDLARIAGQQAEDNREISKAWRDKHYEQTNKFQTSQDGVKGFTPNGERLGQNVLGRKHGSKSNARKAASATIAKIPLQLARWIARVYKPK